MGGNALVEGGTFLAILVRYDTRWCTGRAGGATYFLVSVAVVCFSVLGLLSSYLIPPAQAEAPDLQIDYNPIRSGAKIFASLKTDKSNFYTVFGISWFWFFGATFLTQIPNFSREYLNGSPYVATLLMAMFSIGIGIGSLLSSKLSRGRVELGLVPIGALGMTVCGAWLGLMQFPMAGEPMTVTAMFTQWFSIKALLLCWYFWLCLVACLLCRCTHGCKATRRKSLCRAT